jgi:uncharacterized membrane protein
MPENMNNSHQILSYVAEEYFSLFCHQDPSVLICNSNGCIPLCPRCMGLHIGFVITILVLSAYVKYPIRNLRFVSYPFLLLGISVMAVEWTFAQLSLIESSTLSRLMTGLAAGSNFGLLFHIYKLRLSRSDNSEHSTLNPLHIIALIFLSLSGCSILCLFRYPTVLTFLLLLTVNLNILILLHAMFIRLKLISITKSMLP